MAANLAEIRGNVRKDLHDEDSGAYRWTDAVLDRHITRAVREYSIETPLEQRTTIQTTAGSRDLSISSLTNLVAVEAVEWPTGEFPPRRVGFSQWQTTLTMDVVSEPNAVQDAYVYWTKMHTLDGSSSTIPPKHDELIAAGAAAYAALDWTSYATNRINTGGQDVQESYAAFAAERLAYFRSELRRLGRRNTVRVRRMYTTDAPLMFEQERVKY
jgi:hypothetical protein